MNGFKHVYDEKNSYKLIELFNYSLSPTLIEYIYFWESATASCKGRLERLYQQYCMVYCTLMRKKFFYGSFSFYNILYFEPMRMINMPFE